MNNLGKLLESDDIESLLEEYYELKDNSDNEDDPTIHALRDRIISLTGEITFAKL